jgi:glycosyltransferase involved in cell wall biosynthesis
MVSIITPCYNAEEYLSQTIESVLSQTCQDWEMLIVDDCSSDGSAQIIEEYSRKDSRIKYLKTDRRSGSPTLPRNIGIENAGGRYIAFLDSDDLWLPGKLDSQLNAIKKNKDAAIVFSYYEKIAEDGTRSARVIKSPASVTYDKLLRGNVIGCLTGMYDVDKVGKTYFVNEGHEDYILWLSILKKGYTAVNTEDLQALYRVRERSVSSDKGKAARWQWRIYRDVEKLNLFKSLFCFTCYAFKAIVKVLK